MNMRNVVLAVEKSLEPHTTQVLPSSLNWLYNVAPCFRISGDQVTVLQKPEDFYRIILEKCAVANRRISFASLYLGTGHLEKRLVDTLSSRLNELGNRLKVSILLDANRGSRGIKNSRTMLVPLLDFPSCKVSLFHTPSLRGPLRYLLPPRYNELIGLQHIKLYLFDDSVIISGANLSHDYFTNRQDRYLLINSPELADFYFGLLERISSFSFDLDKNNNIIAKCSRLHPFNAAKQVYLLESKKQISGYYKDVMEQSRFSNGNKTNNVDTLIFPLIELPPFGIHQDSSVTQRILESAEKNALLKLTTGYFNLTDGYKDTILKKSEAKYNILVAHPTANGFFNAPGPAGGIPSAYTNLVSAFLSLTSRLGQLNRISIFEYQRPGWTFHAKGLWQSDRNCQKPFLTVVGSSNFGVRSVNRDLESQIVLITQNERLKDNLLEEQNHLFSLGTPFTEEVASLSDRKPPVWVRTLMWFFKKFL